MKIDLHVHTRASYDGMLTLPKIIRAARRRGLGGFAVTDHNAQAVFSPSETIMIIPGVEYSTDAGHVLALFYTEDVSPPLNDAGRVLLAALCEMVREKGGLLVGAHPFNGKGIRMKHTFTPETYRMLDGLETRNARALSRNKDSRRLAEEAAETYALFTTGGSDGHMAGEIGRAYTVFPDDVTTLGEARQALLDGRCAAAGKAGPWRYRILTRLRKKIMRKLRG